MPDRILVVEDDLLLISALQNILRHTEIEMDSAEHPDQALEKFKAFSYDLLVVDIGLPGRTGLELLEDIRAVDSEMPVIVITGNPTLQHARRAIRLGARDFVQKPLYGPDFLASIQSILADSHDRRVRLRARELEVANRLAVSMCNRFNNMLGGIIGRASLVQATDNLPQEVIHEFDQVQEQARRMADLMRRMALFCQTHVEVDEGIRPVDVLAETIQACGRRFDRTIRLERGTPKIKVDCNAHRLATLFHEIIAYSCELLPPKLSLVVETVLNSAGAAPVLTIRFLIGACEIPELAPEGVIAPLGPDLVNLESGLHGMAIAHAIALQMEGNLEVDSLAGDQNAILLSFPVRMGREHTTLAPERYGFPVKGSVLVVDDNPTVLRLTCDMMDRLTGLETHGTRDAAEALAFVEAEKDNVGLVLLDIILGDESGFDVYQSFRRFCPALPVIFVSGFTGDARLSEILQDDVNAAFLSKPFDMTQLKELLAARSSVVAAS